MGENILTTDMIMVMIMIGIAIFLFIVEWIRVDMVAILMTVSSSTASSGYPEGGVFRIQQQCRDFNHCRDHHRRRS